MEKEIDLSKGLIADLHIHSKYSRATSKNLSLENLEKYARIKGLDILGTGDFQHPIWSQELDKLEEREGILYSKTGFPFVWQTEISLMYTQGRGRRVHFVILAPSREIAKEITKFLSSKGRLDYDGRPIFGFSAIELVESLSRISEDIEIIPAHCLLGDETIHTNHSIKKIKDIKCGDIVYTHNNNWQKVSQVLKREYHGETYKIRPWYFSEGLTTTPEHPFYTLKSHKNCSWIKGTCKKDCSQEKVCKKKLFLNYKPEWIKAKDLEKGDFLIYPRFSKIKDFEKVGENKLTSNICRLIGYYLSEGYLIKDSAIGFSFNKKEKDYLEEVKSLIKEIFGKAEFVIDERKGSDILFFSKKINSFFKQFYNSEVKKANTKVLPSSFLELPLEKQVELFKGWWRGDKGYTVSRELANQMKIICLRLGIIPNILIDTIEKYESRGKHFIKGRKISANYNLYSFSHLSFFEDNYNLLKEPEFRKNKTKMNRKHGWIEKDYVYIPVRKIEIKQFNGEVYNLEVEVDNSYVSEFCCVHNCWTPYFGIFGSMSGFDSLKECFQDQVSKIHAIETGMSSDPEMNWHLSELNSRTIVSFSDLHSFWPWRLAREATIFKKPENKEFTYRELIRQIRENDILGTIETDPCYGKYHFDGHRNCNFSCSPSKTKELKGICPVCNKPLTIGVENRVEEITDQQTKDYPRKKQYYKLLPLHELISFSISSPLASKKTWAIYDKMISKLGNEFNILINVEKETLIEFGELLAELIIKNRQGSLKVKPGYDGTYGEIDDIVKARVGDEEKEVKPLESASPQKTLF